ncbi:protein FAM3C [Acanthochromis polyacanthus]|uniref:Protein FAM3C-like n=1 Tax=Acanthochromis polyacanthus TaxID=80966 RepID=A0A3Q1EST2_9TELE|nr:protein FAM3C [Acanthochromis polyacanthus]XP_022065823.1 protein FAM3C [Acanthochromis polyacanthus]
MIIRRGINRGVVKSLMVLVSAVILLILLLQFFNNPFKTDWNLALLESFSQTSEVAIDVPQGPCTIKRDCPDDHYSFFIQSGAANVVGPKICIQNKLVLGSVLNNVAPGINLVTMNGRSGAVIKTGTFNMYSGEVEPLIDFLKEIDKDSVVLVASYDDPSTKLNDEARKLFVELGSSSIETLKFRDNWVFVGVKGESMKSKHEKVRKNDREINKYDGWPELIDMDGCIPKHLD